MGSRRVKVVVAIAVAVAGMGLRTPTASAAPGDISTVAGGPGRGPALKVQQSAGALAMSGSRLWVADPGNSGISGIRAIDTTTGEESVPLLERDASGAQYVPSLAGDGAGNVFVGYTTQDGTGRVEQLLPSGQTRLVAGGGTQDHVDGVPATSELLHTPSGLTVDSAGNLYISENRFNVQSDRYGPIYHAADSRVRKVSPDGTITTVAGAGPTTDTWNPYTGSVPAPPPLAPLGDGAPARSALLNYPQALATDGAGNLYIAQYSDNRVRRVDTNGQIWTFAGGGTSQADGIPATQADIRPGALAVDATGLLIQDGYYPKIRKVSSGTISTVAGNGTYGLSGDGGPATQASIAPLSMTAGGSGIYFGQWSRGTAPYSAIRRVDASGVVNPYAGMDGRGDGGPALQAQFSGGDLALDAAGHQYVVDGNRVRKIDAAGVISAFAGSGAFPPYPTIVGDGGPATQAAFKLINAIDFGPDGALYIADWSTIRRVDPSGVMSTVAGSGAYGDTPDGAAAIGASLHDPGAITFDSAGNLVFSEDCIVRRINPDGTLSTIGGRRPAQPSTCHSTGDGGPAMSADIAHIMDVTADTGGNLFVAEVDVGTSPGVYRVRRIDTAGIITTLAGGGSGGDGVPATDANIEASALAFDNQGRLLIVSRFGGLVRRVEADGILHTIAGGGTGGDGGPATSASLRWPTAVAVDAGGNLLIPGSDPRYRSSFGVIRKVETP